MVKFCKLAIITISIRLVPDVLSVVSILDRLLYFFFVSWIKQNDSNHILGDPFGDGEEMYLQGAAIWHPRCGPGPTEASQIIFNNTSGEIDRMSNSAMSEIHVSFFFFL